VRKFDDSFRLNFLVNW